MVTAFHFAKAALEFVVMGGAALVCALLAPICLLAFAASLMKIVYGKPWPMYSGDDDDDDKGPFLTWRNDWLQMGSFLLMLLAFAALFPWFSYRAFHRAAGALAVLLSLM